MPIPQIPYLGFCSCEEQGDTGVWQLVDPPILPLTHGPNHSFDWRETLLQHWHLSDPTLTRTEHAVLPETARACSRPDQNTAAFPLSASLHSWRFSCDEWRSCPVWRWGVSAAEGTGNWLHPSEADFIKCPRLNFILAFCSFFFLF